MKKVLISIVTMVLLIALAIPMAGVVVAQEAEEYIETIYLVETDLIPGDSGWYYDSSTIYTVELDDITNRANLSLLTVIPATGNFANSFDTVAALAATPDGNSLYVVDRDSAELARYDIDSVTWTWIGDTGLNTCVQLACALDGTLYASSNGSNELYTINTSTAAATSLGKIRTVGSAGPMVNVQGADIVFGIDDSTEPTTDILYLWAPNSLYSLLPQTSPDYVLATSIGGHSGFSYTGLAVTDGGAGALLASTTSDDINAIDRSDGSKGTVYDMWDTDSNTAYDHKWGDMTIGEFAVEEGKCGDLIAGQHIDVGDVIVSNDDTYLYVTYEITDPDWRITETHLYVGQNLSPTTAPGQFPYSDDDAASVTDTTVTYEIPLDDIDNYSMQTNKKGKSTGVMVADGTAGVESGDLIYIAAHAVVQKTVTEAPYYANTVIDYLQGVTKGGAPVLPARSIPENGLALDDPLSFFSLGYVEAGNGWIIVEFDCPIVNGDGNDVQIIEVTYGSYPSETAEVYASQDGVNWTLLGIADNTNQGSPGTTVSEFDLGTLSWAKYIKVVDTTDPGPHASNADMFDLEAIVSLQDCVVEETAWGYCDPNGGEFPGANWATYLTYHVE